MSNFPLLRQRLHSMGIPTIMLISFCGAFFLAWQGISAEISAREKLAIALKLTHHAMELKYLSADFNGWQTAYALDAIRNIPGTSVDRSQTRARFLKSAQSFDSKLQGMPTELLDASEVADLKKAGRAFAEFMRVDAVIIDAYRKGGAENIHNANQLVLGQEIETFQEISLIIANVCASISQRSEQASNDAFAASTQSRGLFIGGALATLPLLFSFMMIARQSFARQSSTAPQSSER